MNDDPRAVRVGVAQEIRLAGDPVFRLDPPPGPGATSGTGAAGAGTTGPDVEAGPGASGDPLLDGEPIRARLEWLDNAHARLVEVDDGRVNRTAVLFGPVRVDRTRGTTLREVIVAGWRIEVELEPERRARLRELARRRATAEALGELAEIHAIIAGRIVTVSVAPGDAVLAGQQILVVEAMKMQNELRAPCEGTIEHMGVAVGDTIEVGDLLAVIR